MAGGDDSPGQLVARHFNDRAKCVALAASLHPKKTDGVGLVQVKSHLAAGDFPEQSVLGRRGGGAEQYVVARLLRDRKEGGPASWRVIVSNNCITYSR